VIAPKKSIDELWLSLNIITKHSAAIIGIRLFATQIPKNNLQCLYKFP